MVIYEGLFGVCKMITLKEIAKECGVSTATVSNVNSEKQQEAVAALTMLGFSPAPSAKVVTKLLTEQPDIPVEQIIKQALKLL